MAPVSVSRISVLLVTMLAAAGLALPIQAQDSPASSSNGAGNGAASTAQPTAALSSDWVATYREAVQLSGPEPDAEQVGTLPQGSPLRLLTPTEDGLVQVFNPVNESNGWVQAAAVAPAGVPTPIQLSLFRGSDGLEPGQFWGMTHRPTTAWSAPAASAEAWGRIEMWRYLLVVSQDEGGRVLTIDPRSNGYAYVDLSALGLVGRPPAAYFAPPPPDDQTFRMPARIMGSTERFELPIQADHFALDRLTHNEPIIVQGVIDQGDGGRWYHIGNREYVPANRVRLPSPPTQTWAGRWIDANLTEPAILTAYEGDRPVYSALAVKGAVAFQTPTGVYRIIRRVENEIMDSATIGIPRSSPLGYYLKDVLFTQYFTGDGAAIHYNYWRSDWGYGASKGCLGMNYDDSKFFWDFGSVGTVVHIHT